MKNKIFKINFFRFINNKLLITSTLIFIFASIGYLTISLCKDIRAGDDLFQFVYPLWKTNTISIYSFAFFLLLSYEFCSKLYTNKLYETIRCTKKGLLSISINNISVLTIWNLFYCVLLFFYNCFSFLILYSFDKKYIIHIFLNILINIFLINTFSIIFGLTASFFKNKILAYSCIIVYLISGSKIGESLAGTIVTATNNGFNAFKIFNLFNIFPPNMNWTPTYAMGFSILPYRIILIFAWLLLSITISLHYIKTKKANITSIVSFVIVIVLVAAYFQPESKLILNGDPDGEALSDQYYYLNYEVESTSPTFNIEKYDLNIKIDRELNCSATMIPNCNSNEYVFTLYHGYRINSVTGQNGNELNYIRDGDYIEIFATKNIESVTIDYSGCGKGFYSNYQGLYLPGDFPYYPIAGKQIIYDNAYQSVTPNNTPEFYITVSSDLQVYSNLESEGKNVFYGKTKAPCLFAGFLNSKEYMGITIIYPYLYGETIYLDDILQNIYLDEFYGKTIFIEPHVNITFESCLREYDDVMLTPDLGELITVGNEDEKYD